MSTIISELERVLNQRCTASPDTSYVASLFAGGLTDISAKLREETDELIAAAELLEVSDVASNAVSNDTSALVHEAADLWFHSLVLLAHYRCSPDLVLQELEHRFGVSGHEEKRSRTR